MRKIIRSTVLIGFMLETLLPQSNSAIRFNLERMELHDFLPGTYHVVDRYLDPADSVSALNYYLHMAIWVGARNGNTLSVISGDGNPTIKEFPEWHFTTNTYEFEDINTRNPNITVFRSAYDDQLSLPGHTPVGISVEQTTYKWRRLPALVFKYTVKAENAIDSISIGMYFDFDIPEENNTSNAYNDQVLVDPPTKCVFMSNGGEWDKGIMPGVLVLSEDNLYCRVMGSLPSPLSDAQKWEILKANVSHNQTETYTDPDDYRFVVYSDIYTLSDGDSVSFVLALIHTKGIKKSKTIVKRLERWYGERSPAGRRTASASTNKPLLPDRPYLSQNYPNPFNSSTRFEIGLPEEGAVGILVYDVSGRVVKTIFTGALQEGSHTFIWDGRNDDGKDVGSGIYFIEGRGSKFHEMRKVVLIR